MNAVTDPSKLAAGHPVRIAWHRERIAIAREAMYDATEWIQRKIWKARMESREQLLSEELAAT